MLTYLIWMTMDKEFETGLRLNYNIVHNFEKIKQNINNQNNKISLILPKIKTRNIHHKTMENNNSYFNSLNMRVDKQITTRNLHIENENSLVYETINYQGIVNISNELSQNKDQSTEKNLNHIQNELKSDPSFVENKDYYQTPKKEILVKITKEFHSLKEIQKIKIDY
jgi:hypothetical protein